MNQQNDTIAAIATGLTPSGIGIIRMSGPESFKIIESIFTNKKGQKVTFEIPNRIRYGYLNVSRETLDEVLVMNMKAPHSYTGEDTVEINCHGGPLIMKKVLELVIQNGARLADPGDFTKRAFLNGRIDLSQAEAVIDIINAKNERAAKAGISQLKGSLSEAIKSIRKEILGESAFIEAALDDPEHYELEQYGEELSRKIIEINNQISRLIESWKFGKIVKEGINTCILGKPNAGKSSILNALIGEERAIVTDIPGTTRDVIKENIQIGTLSLNIIDTAGIRETEDKVEKIGVERALSYAEKADLILYIIDAAVPLDGSDFKIMEFINCKTIPVLYIINKNDLCSTIPEELKNVSRETISVSAKEKTGIDQIKERISDLFIEGNIVYNDEVMISSERHIELLRQAKASLERVLVSIENELPEDFYTIDMMDAYHSLGLIIGEETEDDLAERIFSDFCMGK